MLSDLQVDVNGQETFSVSMKILASFSGKLRKMFGKSEEKERESFKLIFHDFPSGAEGFELVVRFCYSRGKIDISPSNVVRLHSAAVYLEIDEDRTSKFFENAHSWTWLELLTCLKQCQELFPFMSSSLVQEILNAVVEKISMHNSSTPFEFSCSDFSSEISTVSSSSSSSPTACWFQDLEFLNTGFFEKVVNTMISHKLDHGVICSFLLHYQKVKYKSLLPQEKKCRIIETLITSLSSLNFIFFPFRKLCDILQACHTLKMAKIWSERVERIIGSRLDEATLDDLIIPSHCSRNACAYDVNLVLRLLRVFSRERGKKLLVPRLKRAGFLLDSYLREVAPDPRLGTKKFLALALALPDSARESYDTFYEGVALYFKVHGFMSEEEKIRICSVLNFEKLSPELLVDLANNNGEFPDCVAAAALEIMESKFKKMGSGVENLEFRLDSSLSKKKECMNLQKIYADIARVDVKCPTSRKSLPRLCS